MSTENLMLFAIIIPIVAAVITLVVVRKNSMAAGGVTIAASFVNLFLAYRIYGTETSVSVPWAGWFFEFTLRNYQFSSFILISVAIFGALLSVYNAIFLKEKANGWLFHAYFLLTIGFVNGVVFADNLILLLFFWEGLLGIMFGMIYLGGANAYRTSIKAAIIAGVTDLCMMFGIGTAIYLAKTATISDMKVSMEGLGGLAFVLLVIGAISKAGAMPFHTWIPDAASDAPMPFMSFFPGALEKLLGIYLLVRITLDIFELDGMSWGSTMLMIIGALTIVLAVAMALIQKDYKRLLSYHAISQVGYMILGIGTCTPVGIVGGLFHMINNTLYKCCLFLTGGSMERQAGTTDLKKIGGLKSQMPLTFIIFIIAAASISGVPPFNGFFSKEMVYDGALERGTIFYLAAVLGSVMTAASFLKLGHAAYVDKRGDVSKVKEAPAAMLVPGMILAALCLFFGLGNVFPLREFIQPVLGARLEGHDFSGFHFNIVLVGGTVVALALAVINHFVGVKKTGNGLGAVDHVHYAPGLHQVYDAAEKRYFDPYNWAKNVGRVVAYIGWGIDRGIDFFFSKIIPFAAMGISAVIRSLHNGSHVTYLAWSLAGLALVIIACMTGRL
ncbi:MAG: NADH-quinone oxidoreductase subunit L [Acidobacteriota bacterium]|jgi:NADH-quinone oxidoreductase subunit L|nr:NADH-quinone oxidoreductase subunit L [Acidobacteriota bacterium]